MSTVSSATSGVRSMPKIKLCGFVRGVGLKESRVGCPPAGSGRVIALAAGDLRIKNPIQNRGQIIASAHVHEHLVGIGQPIQVAPDFAAPDILRALLTRQFAHRLQRGDSHADVRVVFVRGVVRVDKFGLRRPQDFHEIFLQPVSVGLLTALLG